MISLNYRPAGPTIARFHKSNAFIRGIMGPVGSAKSSGCCWDLFLSSSMQEKSKDGIRRTRHAVVRETYPELKSTTLKTWLDWFPERVFGRMRWDTPITHHIKMGDLDMEVLFLACDRPDDVKKLLSLECTFIWLNEAKLIDRVIFEGATGRPGRYPSQKERPDHIPKQDWPTRYGIIMDTNPPDDDSWWYKLCEEPDLEQQSKLEEKLREMGALKEGQPLIEFFKQPSGLSPEAENIENLPTGYYQRIMAGKSEDWIKVYVMGQYGNVEDGKPVFPEYNDQLHCAPRPLAPINGLPILLAWDYGLTPAVTFHQMTPRGQWRIIDELVSERMGVRQFAEAVVKPHIDNAYPGFRIICNGDPAGKDASQPDEEISAVSVLKALDFEFDEDRELTNEFQPRREAVAYFLTRLVDGEPAFLISPKCKMTRKGLRGAYRFRRLAVAGESRFTEKPDKNKYSHPLDSVQYAALHYYTPPKVKRPTRRATRRYDVADKAGGY